MEAEYPSQDQTAQDELAAPEFDTSFFPAPSPYFHRYTTVNLALPPDAIISDVPGEPTPFPAQELEPPNVDWIVEEGNYSVFGETWPIEEHLPTLEEMGLKEMFDKSKGEHCSLISRVERGLNSCSSSQIANNLSKFSSVHYS
jgi:mediator of RNA polymerase II transcription subunit 7